MTVAMYESKPRMPASLVAAMENEVLSEEQLRDIVRIEAAQFGLKLEDAIELALQNRLPATPAGFDLQFHIFMLIS